VLDADGYVIIKDRSKDIIISGGENISSVEVEDVLYKHPAVMFAAVVAKPDPKWGEVPCAFVELKDRAAQTATEARSSRVFCRKELPGFKTPKAKCRVRRSHPEDALDRQDPEIRTAPTGETSPRQSPRKLPAWG
jgi:acyl-CoA synthetase (AMP-forming)/AMP-acid ligase II